MSKMAFPLYYRRAVIAILSCTALTAALVAQQLAHRAAKVEIENQFVHAVRNVHAPHEKTPMHSHRDAIVVYLTDVHERSTYPDGTSKEITHRAGDVVWSPAHTHTLENLADKPIEVVEIEPKGAPGSQ